MIQDIAPHLFDNAYGNRRPAHRGDRILCYRKNEVFLVEAKENPSGFDFPVFEQIFREEEKELYYLFSVDDIGYFLINEDEFLEQLEGSGGEGAVFGPGGGFQATQVFRSMGEGDPVPLIMMTGLHIYTWMRKNRFCGCCGSKTEQHPTERAFQCPSCRNLIFPQISPSVAVGVVNGDRILLARGLQSPPNRFGLIAGFVEVGESVEETVRREVLEEVGLKVKNLEYFKSQPWGLTGIEMLGFFVELDGDDTIKVQESELAEAVWRTADEIDRTMAQHSLSYTIIQEFCRRQDAKKGRG